MAQELLFELKDARVTPHIATYQARMTAFLQELAQLGWINGRNVRIDTRWGVGDADRVRKYAAELVAVAPDVILANSRAALAALLQATPTVPIVFTAVGDPVGAGYVDTYLTRGFLCASRNGLGFTETRLHGTQKCRRKLSL
jgi:ABC-type uncharacterized transport system substrate-binding protein